MHIKKDDVGIIYNYSKLILRLGIESNKIIWDINYLGHKLFT